MIAETLLRYADHPLQKPKAVELVEEHGLQRILNQLRDAHQLDFTQYKQATVLRRAECRLLLKQSPSVEEYCRQLEGGANELNQLYCDLLIGVTRFFREREAFEYLEQTVIPNLLEHVPPDEEIPIWVAGCATGEEAYSLALLLPEQLTASGRPLNARAFAIDVHRGSLETADAGKYKFMALSELSSERLQRYFTATDDGYYQVNKETSQPHRLCLTQLDQGHSVHTPTHGHVTEPADIFSSTRATTSSVTVPFRIKDRRSLVSGAERDAG